MNQINQENLIMERIDYTKLSEQQVFDASMIHQFAWNFNVL